MSNSNEDWVHYSVDTAHDVGIFTLTTCTNNVEYRTVLSHFFDEVFANDIQNVIVDLRGNGGGNSSVANEFLTYIDVDTYESWENAVRFGWYLLRYQDVVMEVGSKPKAT